MMEEKRYQQTRNYFFPNWTHEIKNKVRLLETVDPAMGRNTEH